LDFLKNYLETTTTNDNKYSPILLLQDIIQKTLIEYEQTMNLLFPPDSSPKIQQITNFLK